MCKWKSRMLLHDKQYLIRMPFLGYKVAKWRAQYKVLLCRKTHRSSTLNCSFIVKNILLDKEEYQVCQSVLFQYCTNKNPWFALRKPKMAQYNHENCLLNIGNF